MPRKTEEESRELAPQHNGALTLTNLDHFAISEVEPAELEAIFRDNFAGETISPFDLTQIQVGRGGVTMWAVKGTEDNIKEFAGVILHVRTSRAFWETEFGKGGGDTPPDCNSQDGYAGNGVFGKGSAGNPSGMCATCPMSKFGTAQRNGEKGKGIACAENRILFVQKDDAIIPVVVKAPPTSLKPARRYLMIDLSNARLRYHQIVTHFALKQEMHGGFKTAVVALKAGQRLGPEAQSRIDGIRAALMPMFTSMTVSVEREAAE